MDRNVSTPPKGRITCGLIAAFMLFLPAVPAQASWLTSYTFTLNDDSPDLTNVVLMEAGENWGSTTWSFEAPGHGATSTINNMFPHASLPTSGLVFGLVNGLSTDGESPQDHLVMFMSDAAAAAVAGTAWESLFAGVSESQLIDALKTATSGESWDIVTPALDILNDFANGAATTDILGTEGESISSWFSMPGSFSIVAFSDGSIIGSGTSSVTAAPPAVPEPASLALAGLAGLIVMADQLRRRRAA